jgi:poly(A) polymerase
MLEQATMLVKKLQDADQLHDYFDGVQDIKDGILRFVGNAHARIEEDRLRILRAVKFLARYEMETDVTACDAIEVAMYEEALKNIARERITAEFQEIIQHRSGVQYLVSYEMMHHIIPGIEATWGLAGEQDEIWHAEGNTWVHTQMVLDVCRELLPAHNIEPFPFLLAALLHDIGKPATQRCYGDGRISNHKHAEIGAEMAENICRHWLKLPNDTTKYVTHLVGSHMRMHQVQKMSGTELIQLMEDPFFESMMLLQHADALGRETKQPKESHLGFLKAKKAEFDLLPEHRRPSSKPLITGKDLISRGLAAGVWMGEFLKRGREAQLKGEIDPETKESWLDAKLCEYAKKLEV